MEGRTKELFFQTLELLRKEVSRKFGDWKDADDWLFAQLDFTRGELLEIYRGRNALVCVDSAKPDLQ